MVDEALAARAALALGGVQALARTLTVPIPAHNKNVRVEDITRRNCKTILKVVFTFVEYF